MTRLLDQVGIFPLGLGEFKLFSGEWRKFLISILAIGFNRGLLHRVVMMDSPPSYQTIMTDVRESLDRPILAGRDQQFIDGSQIGFGAGNDDVCIRCHNRQSAGFSTSSWRA